MRKEHLASLSRHARSCQNWSNPFPPPSPHVNKLVFYAQLILPSILQSPSFFIQQQTTKDLQIIFDSGTNARATGQLSRHTDSYQHSSTHMLLSTSVTALGQSGFGAAAAVAVAGLRQVGLPFSSQRSSIRMSSAQQQQQRSLTTSTAGSTQQQESSKPVGASDELLSRLKDKQLLRTCGLIGGKWSEASNGATFDVSSRSAAWCCCCASHAVPGGSRWVCRLHAIQRLGDVAYHPCVCRTTLMEQRTHPAHLGGLLYA